MTTHSIDRCRLLVAAAVVPAAAVLARPALAGAGEDAELRQLMNPSKHESIKVWHNGPSQAEHMLSEPSLSGKRCKGNAMLNMIRLCIITVTGLFVIVAVAPAHSENAVQPVKKFEPILASIGERRILSVTRQW